MLAKKGKRIEPLDVAVGHRIRVLRVAKHMSQSALGEALGITFQQVQKYEKGINRVGASRLARIAEVLDSSVAALFKEPESEGERVVDMADTRQIARIMELATRMNPYQRTALMKLLESMAGKK